MFGSTKSTQTRRVGIIACASLAIQVALAPSAYADGVKLAERTSIKVAVMDSLRSGSEKVGDEVQFEVREDIFGPNRELLITKGTPAYGKITRSERRKAFGKPGKLDFTCEYAKAVDGTRVPLRSSETSVRGKDNSGAMMAAALLVTVFGVFVNGRDVEVKKGTEFTVYVDQDTLINIGGTVDAQQIDGKSRVTLTDGSVVIGVMKGLQDGVYTILTNGQEVKIPSNKVKSIESAKPASAGESVTFQLKDGQTIKGKILEQSDGVYKVETIFGVITVNEKDIAKRN